MAIVPAAAYFAAFVVVTYPLMLRFSTHLMADEKDGLTMVWNIWWVNKAVTELHVSPWYTHYIHFPQGVSLLTHTLCPLKGFAAIFLLPFLTLTQTYNFLVVCSFVFAGLATFWLSFYITRGYWASIVAGFIFSFSNYHFSHMLGHLNLTSLEWIPLFVLCWHVFMRRPGILIGLASSLSLLAVILCDYYYFFYCIVIALIMFVWHAIRERRPWFFTQREYAVPLSVFLSATLMSSGVLIGKLLLVTRNVTFVGVHEPREFSTDLLSPFVYGSYLRFSHLTEGFWTRLTGNTSESSVYMGISVLALMVYVWVRRQKIRETSLHLWYVMLLFFLVMSLGPALHVGGKLVAHVPMPYSLLELTLPALKFSGVPSRMMAVVMLCAAVISAMGLHQLLRSPGKLPRAAGALLVVLLFAEFLPLKIRPYRPEVPEYVRVLRNLPGNDAVIDAGSDTYHAVYYQTIHEKPIAMGKVARLPQSAYDSGVAIVKLVRAGDYNTLRSTYGFRYLVSGDGRVRDLRQR